MPPPRDEIANCPSRERTLRGGAHQPRVGSVDHCRIEPERAHRREQLLRRGPKRSDHHARHVSPRTRLKHPRTSERLGQQR
jgi:hypothetical protein